METELIQYALLPSDLNEHILDQLWDLRPDEQNKITMFGKIIDTPRRFKVYGKTYKFNGMKEQADDEIPELILPYLDLINTIDTGYNSVLVNWYDGGNEYIGFHSDKTDHLVPDSNIYGISFGSERIMRFKNKEHKTLIDFRLEHNSIINMVGGCQDVFQHSIIQNKKISGKRISLTFRKVICANNIMEAKTRPKYNEFLKEWSQKNKITSFFGSDKAEFLQQWNNVKTAGTPALVVPIIKPVETVVEAVAERVEGKVGDTIFSNNQFYKIIKLTVKTVTLKPLETIVVSDIRDKKSIGDSQNEFGIQTIKAGEPLEEDEQSGKTRTKIRKNVNLTKQDTIIRKYDTFKGN